MNRQRKANPKAVTKTIAFLQALKHQVTEHGEPDLYALLKNHHISNSTAIAVRALKFIMQDSNNNWVFRGDPHKFGREMALEILEYNLAKTKKYSQPELIENTNILKEISEKLTVNIDQTQLAMKQARIPRQQTETLFSKEEQAYRDVVYLSGQIAPALYNKFDANMVSEVSDRIINAAESLLSKINARYGK